MEDDKVEILSSPEYNNLHKLAVRDSDAVIFGNEIAGEVVDFAKENDKTFIHHTEEEYIAAYNELYDKILDESSVLAE